MNGRQRILLALTVSSAVGFAAWWFWPSGAEVSAELSSPGNQSKAVISTSQVQEKKSQTQEEAGKQVLQKLEQFMDAGNVPINFWGKVVDQDSQPLEGVKVVLGLRKWNAAGATFPEHTLTTDANGLFSLRNTRGDGLEITLVQKEGYELSSKSYRGGSYLHPQGFSPDPNKPVIFKMWKLQGAEPLIYMRKGFELSYDGTPIVVDLFRSEEMGRGGRNGDIQVSLTRTPAQISWGSREPYKWIAAIEALNGGVVETRDEFMYMAPGDGYSNKIEMVMEADQPGWRSDKTISFYFKGRDGTCYGRIVAEFMSHFNEKNALCRIDAYINPNGSRNLEYDQSKEIK